MSGHLSLIFTSCNLEVTLHVPDLLLEPSPEDLKLTNAFMNFVHFLCVFPVVVVQMCPSAFTTLPPRKKDISNSKFNLLEVYALSLHFSFA